MSTPLASGADLKRDLDRDSITALVESSNWFPFVEIWSNLTAADMFETLVYSAYGGKASEIPKMRIQFSPADFQFAIPARFRKPIPQLGDGSSTGGFVLLTHDIDNRDYRQMNAVGEFYMEDLRLSSSKRRFKTHTPIEMWDQDRQRILEIAREKSGPDAGPYEIRNAVFSFTKESNPFRPTIALAVYALLDANNILDMSSGWGDRLIGALAWARRSKRAIRYQGYDPFCELQPRYAAIIADFTPKERSDRFAVTCAPFEEAPIEEGAFDVAFTSPPYFDFEEYAYSSSSGKSREFQSTVRYPQMQDWINGFLKPMMQRAARSLRIGGHLAINIEGPFVNNLLEHSMTDPSLFGSSGRLSLTERPLRMEYQGLIGYRSDSLTDRITHPIFVWRRV